MMTRPRRGAWTPEDIATLREMAAAGKSKVTMAVRLGRSIQGIEREATALGIELQPRKRPISYRELDRQQTDR